MIEEDDIGRNGGGRSSYLFQFSLAYQCRGFGPIAPLRKLAGNFRTRTGCERPEFVQRFLGAEFRRIEGCVRYRAGSVIPGGLNFRTDRRRAFSSASTASPKFHSYEE